MKALPTIAIAGVGQSRVYLSGTDIRVFPPDIDAKKLVGKITLPFLLSVILRRDVCLSKSLYKAVCASLEYLSLDENGHEKHQLCVEGFSKSFSDLDEKDKKFIRRMLPADKIASKIGEENFYFYTYNSFGDTEKIIDQLHSFILAVAEEKGVERVNLAPVSLGGTVATAYLSKYGNEKKVHRVVGVVPAYDGSSLACKIFDGDFTSLADEIIPRELKKVTALLPEKLVGRLAQTVINAFRDKVFLNSPMAWGAVPHDDYVRLRDKLGIKGNLRKTCDKFFAVRNDFHSFVKLQKENGTEIFSLCGYGLFMEKMIRTHDFHSDGIVDTSSSTMGAECSDINEKPDVTKSAIADRVWLFEKMGHEESAKNELLLTLTAELISSDRINSVNDDINFPQFN